MNPTDYDIYDTHGTALKPCPFCGASPRIVYLDDDFEETDGYDEKTMYAAVQCTGCNVIAMHMILMKEETSEVIVRWNRRT